MLSEIFFRLRSLFRRNTVEAEVDDELRFHFEQQVEKCDLLTVLPGNADADRAGKEGWRRTAAGREDSVAQGWSIISNWAPLSLLGSAVHFSVHPTRV
jgi:hypothetical protein